LTEILTPENYARIEALGQRLADGLDTAFDRHRLPWKAFRLGPRSGFCLFPTLPVNGSEAHRSMDLELIDTRRVFMANRGVWDAIASAGPQVSFAHTADDIDRYVAVANEFLDRIVT
jgi:glutamate-1-semialdehyde aminotransferase